MWGLRVALCIGLQINSVTEIHVEPSSVAPAVEACVLDFEELEQ